MRENDIRNNQKDEPTFIERLHPADLIALIVILGGIFLTFYGVNNEFGPLMLTVVAFYFGLKSDPSKPA